MGKKNASLTMTEAIIEQHASLFAYDGDSTKVFTLESSCYYTVALHGGLLKLG